MEAIELMQLQGQRWEAGLRVFVNFVQSAAKSLEKVSSLKVGLNDEPVAPVTFLGLSYQLRYEFEWREGRDRHFVVLYAVPETSHEAPTEVRRITFHPSSGKVTEPGVEGGFHPELIKRAGMILGYLFTGTSDWVAI